MTARAKSTLLLLATLLIGMVLRALLNARLAEQRLERIGLLRSQRGFVHFMERMIQPEDAAQREAVRAILNRAAERMQEVMENRFLQMRAIMNSTKAELRSVLTETQMEQLEERLEAREQGFRERRRRRGFPPR